MAETNIIEQIQNEVRNVVGAINQLRLDFEKFTVKSEKEHEHQSEKLDEHIKEGNEKYDRVNNMLDTLYHSMLQLQGDVDAAERIYKARNETKEKAKASQQQWRIALFVTAGTISGAILAVVIQRVF